MDRDGGLPGHQIGSAERECRGEQDRSAERRAERKVQSRAKQSRAEEIAEWERQEVSIRLRSSRTI
jgi:hypothetical protein